MSIRYCPMKIVISLSLSVFLSLSLSLYIYIYIYIYILYIYQAHIHVLKVKITTTRYIICFISEILTSKYLFKEITSVNYNAPGRSTSFAQMLVE